MTLKAYRLADWTIYPDRNGIMRGGVSRKLESRVMQVLVYFCENPNRVISRNELIEAIWGPVELSKNSVNVAIAAIRNAFGDDARNPRIIETHSKRGYELIVPPEVFDLELTPQSPGPRSLLKEPIRVRILLTAFIVYILGTVSWVFLHDRAADDRRAEPGFVVPFNEATDGDDAGANH